MAWEIAKGILIAVGIILIGIPLIIVAIRFLFEYSSAIFGAFVRELKVGPSNLWCTRCKVKLQQSTNIHCPTCKTKLIPWNNDLLPAAERRSPFPYCPKCFAPDHEAKAASFETWKMWRCKTCKKKEDDQKFGSRESVF
jgi:hypothetical protein